MTHDKELIERAAKSLHCEWMPEEGQFEQNSEEYRNSFRQAASRLLDVVRSYDREQRAKIDAAIAPVSNPDDYRDLPAAMTTDVRFKGGLTEGKP